MNIKTKRLHKLIFAVLILPVSPGIAQHDMHSMGMAASNDKPIELIKNIGNLHHPVATSNKKAQQYFDQGLALIYALNTEDATRSFKRAIELDSNLAMAYWGLAAANVGLSSAFEISNEERKNAYEQMATNAVMQSDYKEAFHFMQLFHKL